MTWAPLTEKGIDQEIARAREQMSHHQLKLWNTIKLKPAKWSHSPYADAGGGFWVIAIIGNAVVRYNDIEEGFEHSCYMKHGSISEYACNQLALGTILEQIRWTIEP